MLSPPPSFERAVFYQHFLCPWCGHQARRAIIEKVSWNPFTKASLRPRYWCECCGRCSQLSYSVLVFFVWGVVAGGVMSLIAFGPVGGFIQNLFAAPWWVPWGLAIVVALSFWPIFSRQCLRYERANPSAP